MVWWLVGIALATPSSEEQTVRDLLGLPSVGAEVRVVGYPGLRPMSGFGPDVGARTLGRAAGHDLLYMFAEAQESMCDVHSCTYEMLQVFGYSAFSKGDYRISAGYFAQAGTLDPTSGEVIVLEWSLANMDWGRPKGERHLDHALCLVSPGSAWLAHRANPSATAAVVAEWLVRSGATHHLMHLRAPGSGDAGRARRRYEQALALGVEGSASLDRVGVALAFLPMSEGTWSLGDDCSSSSADALDGLSHLIESL